MTNKKPLNQSDSKVDFSAADAFQQAIEQHQQGNFAQAEALYQQILQHEPNHPDALHFLGVMAYQLGNYPAAIELINKALLSSPSVGMYSNLALVFQAQGNFEQLINTYQQALLLENNPAIHFSLANVLAQQGKLPEAVISYQAALALNPDESELHNSLGNAFVGLGNVQAAAQCYRKVLTLKPDYGQVHNNLGNLLKEQGKLEEAVASYQQALTFMPDYARGYHNLAVTFYAQGKQEQAIENYQKSIALEPHHESYYNLGCVFQEQRKLEEAATCFEQAIALKADFAEAYHNLGVVLQKQGGKLEAAIENYEKAIAINPEHGSVYGDLACAFDEVKNSQKSAENYEKALLLSPDNVHHHYNLARLLSKQGKFDEAIQCCQKAILLKPDFLDTYNVLSVAWQEKGCYPAAIAVLRQVLAYQLYNGAFNFNLGVMLLSCGQYEEGWQHAEYRYDTGVKEYQFAPPKVLFPQWQGEPIAGKSILIWHEQGFGDEIQFCRYAAVLKRMGASYVTLACKKPLQPLFETLSAVDKLLVVDEESDIASHDYWTFLLSIPLHCKTTINNIPVYPHYLMAAPARVEYWKAKLPHAKMRIGLVWKGSSVHANDANRSLAHLDKLLPLWTVPDCAFVSLQKGQGEDEVLSLPENCPITHLGSDITDFADTAAIVSLLDLVICVDTSIAHLAGALGKPVWVLLPFTADWRWIINREDNPWYPNLRLFRQARRSSWDEVIERMTYRLKRVIAGESPLIGSVADAAMSESQKTQLVQATKYRFHTVLALAKQRCTFKDAFPFEAVKAVFAANKNSAAASQWSATKRYLYAGLQENGIYAYPTAPMQYCFKLKINSKYGKPTINLLPVLNSFVNAGNDFLMQGNWDKAAENYARVLAVDNNCAEAHNNLGVVFQNQGKLNQAIKHYQQAISIKPDYAEAQDNLAIALKNQEKTI